MTPLFIEDFEGYTIELHFDLCAGDPRIEFDDPSDCDYEAWAKGEVYGFIIKDSNGKELDSCWGFYGSYPHCLEEARDVIKCYRESDYELMQESISFAE